MNAFEKLQHVRKLAKARAKKFYDLHKEEILLKRKGQWKKMVEDASIVGQGYQNNAPIIVQDVVVEDNFVPVDFVPDIVPIVIANKKKNKGKKNEKPLVNFEYIKNKLENFADITSGTRKKYIDDSKTLLRITGCEDMTMCLKKSKEIISEIENAKQVKDPTKTYSINTKKGLFQTIVYLIDKLEIPLTAKLKAVYVDQFEKYKIESNNEDRNKGETENVINFNTVISRIKEKFGQESKQYLLIKLYDTLTCRDNYGSLTIIESKAKIAPEKNYIIVPKNKATPCVIVLQVYKTSKKNLKIEESCDKDVSALIRNYINEKKLSYNDYLFGKSKLSGLIGLMLKTVGIDGSINYIRTSKLSTELDKEGIKDAALRLKFSKKSQHSPVTQLRYLRTVVD